MDAICTFRRVEKKYLLTENQYEALLAGIGGRLKPDAYGRSTVLSLYLDTPDHRIICNSMEAADYKEKLRLRAYGAVQGDSRVFLELKKKFEGVVYKRRAAMTLAQAEDYLLRGVKPFESQIMAELDWAMARYGRPQPRMLIACEREAWFAESCPELRLTFDRGLRCRDRELSLRQGSAGAALLPEGRLLLEIKTGGAMPLWLAAALDAQGILPGSFSKYGTAYTRTQQQRSAALCPEGGTGHVVNL